ECARLGNFQRRGGAELMLALCQLKRFLECAKRSFRNALELAVCRKRQVGVCNLGDERYLNTAAILLYGKILLQGSIAEVAHAAPEIELKGGYADLRGIGFDVWKRAIIFRTIETALGVYRRQTLRPLNSVERAGALHVERSHAQVAVV